MLKDLYFKHLMKRAAASLPKDAPAQQLARALDTAARARFSPDESAWIARIETIRADLNDSTDDVRQPDYGAATADPAQPAVITRKVGELCRSASKPKLWAGFLMSLVRQFKPAAAIELGTCLGISACYEAAALRLNNFGRLTTLEGAPEFAQLAQKNFDQLQLNNVSLVVGPFQKTLDQALQLTGPVDYAFIDGHHQEAPTIEYFQKISQRAKPGALFIFDDINWSPGMKRAWKTITADPQVRYPLNLHTLGVCIYGKG